MAANNIYLPYEQGFMPDLDTYTFDFDDLVDAINDVENREQGTEVKTQTSNLKPQNNYDLQGRRTQATPKGQIYIHDHKKVIEK